MAPFLEVKDLTHIYSKGTPFEHKALDGVSFSVERGEFIGVIGHTGSGKSTLMQHLNGLLKPDSGSIWLDGKDIWSDKKLTRQARFRVGLVFQYPEYQLFEETVYKDIAFGPKNMGLPAGEIDRRVRETAALVSLSEEMLEVSPFDLSGGQKRRVAIAGVMAMEPDILISEKIKLFTCDVAHAVFAGFIELHLQPFRTYADKDAGSGAIFFAEQFHRIGVAVNFFQKSRHFLRLKFIAFDVVNGTWNLSQFKSGEHKSACRRQKHQQFSHFYFLSK